MIKLLKEIAINKLKIAALKAQISINTARLRLLKSNIRKKNK